MEKKLSLSQQVAEIGANLKYEDLPERVINNSKTVSPELKKYKRHDEIIEALRSLDYVYFIDEL